MAPIPTPYELLRRQVTQDATSAGVPWDTYHADFLFGSIFGWLEKHDAVLTASGVKKVSEL